MPLIAHLLSAVLVASPMSQAESAHFSTDDAARCAAAYAFTLDAMARANAKPGAKAVPDHIVDRMRDGLATWEYELAASAPEEKSEVLQAAANRAVAYMRADMPNGEGSTAAQARGDYLTSATGRCAEKIETAYAGREHPVIPFLRKDEVAVKASPSAQRKAPATAVAENSEKPKRGLR